MTNNRPIIVIGCPRSGTTLLQLMLHAHPRIAIPPENRFVLPAYRKRWQFGDLREEANRQALAKWIVKSKKTKFADLGLDPKKVTQEIVEAPPTVGSALAAVFRAYARKFDKPRWGDKRPKYGTKLHIVRRLFPGAQFVNIVRDGRDCVASLKEMTWYEPDAYFAACTWAMSVDQARRASRELGPDSFHELRYEDLVVDPERELRALCDYLGEDYHPAMTEPSQVASVIPERKTHHARTYEPVTDERVSTWRERLDPWEISLCEWAFGDRQRAYGYKSSGAAPPPLASRLRYWQVAARRRPTVPMPVVRACERLRRYGPVAAQIDQPASTGTIPHTAEAGG